MAAAVKAAPPTAQQYYKQWFEKQQWQSFPYQLKVLQQYSAGKNGLLNAPTGSGKTYAVWLPVITNWLANNKNTPKTRAGLKAIWLTPVRALATDIRLALQHACNVLEMGWKVEVRSGDTGSAARAKQKKTPPQGLVTTPESLHLILANKDYAQYLKGVEAIVIDEWHDLLGTKRATQVELALARIKAINPTIKVWAISATVGNLEQALQVATGVNQPPDSATIVKADIDKSIVVESIIPDEVETYPWGGHLGTKLLPKVIPIIMQSRTSLLFTNTRSQCEIWYQRLLETSPDLAGLIALHHGSLAPEVRQWVEKALHAGSLKAVVCTSSLDLGVDFRPVETIVQIGGPKGVARFLQRAGRSGHAPGALSKIFFVPTHSLELVEASALRQALKSGNVESKKPIETPYDVLAQWMVTLALSDGFTANGLFQELLTTYAYRALTSEEFNEILLFVTQGGKSLYNYQEFSKIKPDEAGVYRVINRRVAMRHRVSIGTITSEAVMGVRMLRGGYLGTIEEYFITKLKPGDTFAYAGRALQFVAVKDNTAIVRKATKKPTVIPSWLGGRFPLSIKLSELIRQRLDDYLENLADDAEMRALEPLFARQREVSLIPHNNEFLIEQYKSRSGYHIFFYTFEGRFINEGMSALLAYRISSSRPFTFSLAFTDYGFEMLSEEEIDMEDILQEDIFTTDNLLPDLEIGINSSQMATRKFRDIARIAGLVFSGMPGKELKARHLQANTQLFFNVFKKYEPDNLFYRQAYNEVMSEQLEEERLRIALQRIRQQKIRLVTLDEPSPFCFPILVERLRTKLTNEKLEDRIDRILKKLD